MESERSGGGIVWLACLWCRWLAAQRAVGPDCVVLVPPASGQHSRLQQRVKELGVQQLVSELPFEGFDVTVLSRAAGFDRQRRQSHSLQPVANCVCGEVSPVVGQDIAFGSSPNDQVAQSIHNSLAVEFPCRIDRQAFSRVP